MPVTWTTAKRFNSKKQFIFLYVTVADQHKKCLMHSCASSKVEEVFPGELDFLCACNGHDDLHDDHGLPDGEVTQTQRHSRGPKPVPLHHVLGETAAPRPLHHEPPLLPLLCACTGRLDRLTDIAISSVHYQTVKDVCVGWEV